MKLQSVKTLLFCFVLSLVWLYPFDFRKEQLLFCGVFCLSILALFVLKNKYVCLASLLVISVTMCIFFIEYLYCFVPTVCFLVSYKFALTEHIRTAAGYDALFCIVISIAAIIGIISCFYAIFQFREPNSRFIWNEKAFFIFAAALFMLLSISQEIAVSCKKKNIMVTGPVIKKVRLTIVLSLINTAAIVVFSMKASEYNGIYSFPSFIFFMVFVLFNNPFLSTIKSKFFAFEE